MRRVVIAVVIMLTGVGVIASFQSTPGLPAGKPARALTVVPSTAPPVGASPPTDPPSSGTAPPAQTLTGDAFANQYGAVQVRVTMQGGTITGVGFLQMPTSHRRSLEISQQAAPLLRQEALQAQSAQIDILSGATFTSESYAQSLQSALDQAHG